MIQNVAIFAILVGSVAAVAEVQCNYDGKNISNGEVITVQNAFDIKCITDANGAWRTEIIGCVANHNGTQTKIPAGEKRDVGHNVFECVKNENGQIMLKETKGAKAPCQGDHPYGSEWQDKSFRFKCAEGGVTKFIECIGTDGTIIKVGGTGLIGGIEVKCEQHDNGTISMGAAKDPKSYPCELKNGTVKQYGEKYTEGNFVRLCGEFGKAKIVGCAAEGVSDPVPLNQNVTVGNTVHSCIKDGEKYSYRAYGNQEPSIYSLCSHEGKQYTNDTTFIAQSAFRMRCVTFANLSSILEVVSCITPAGIEIPIGARIHEGDRIFECTSGNVTLTSTPGRSAKCRGVFGVGQTWVEDSFKFQCESFGKTLLLGCITKEGVEIPLGEQRRIPAGYAMECVTDDGKVALRAAKNAKCVDGNGQNKDLGETYAKGNFVYECQEYGISQIVGCTAAGHPGTIGFNQNVTVGIHVHSCIRNGDSFSFKTYAGGKVAKN